MLVCDEDCVPKSRGRQGQIPALHEHQRSGHREEIARPQPRDLPWLP